MTRSIRTIVRGMAAWPRKKGLKVIPTLSAALVSFSLAGVALAQDGTLPDFKKRFYINGGIGATQIEPESPTDALTVSDNSDSGAHVAIGYDFSRFLSIEGYFADLGTAQIAFLGDNVGTVDYQVYGVSALGYLFNTQSGFFFGDNDTVGNFRREGLSLYGRAGVGQIENSSVGVDFFQDHPTHVAFGLGLEYGFRNGFALRTEMMYFDTDAQYINVGLLKRFGKSYVPAVLPVPAVVVPEVEAPAVALNEVDPLLAPIPDLPSVPEPDPVVPPRGNFEFDRSDISPRFAKDLDALAAVLLNNDISIVINGHTDWIGTENYNDGLSDRRAQSVSRYLQSRGVEASRLIIQGFGETQPIVENTTSSGRAMNRRVEIEIQ